jgi:hypothetical protein
VSDRLTAWVRTVVPALWSTLVAWLVSRGLPPAVTDAAAGLGELVVVPAALAAVYALLRWVERRLPKWLAVVFLGSARTPVYGRQHSPPGDFGSGLAEGADPRGM